MRKAKREQFKDDETYDIYCKTWEANKDGESYSKAVMNLITLFVDNKSNSDEVVETSQIMKDLVVHK